MTALGLDLASRLTGWCVGDGAEAPVCGAWAFPPVRGDDGSYDYGLLLATLDDYLTACHARFAFSTVAYEAPILVFRRRGQADDGSAGYNDNLTKLRLLYPLGAYVEFWCLRHGVECFEVTVQAIKKELGGHRHAEKADLVYVAQKCGLQLPTGPAAQDAADAFGAWLLLLRSINPARSADWDRRLYSSKGSML